MSPDLAVARRAFKQVWKGSVAWALVFGATIASSALSYVSSFPDQASRDEIAATTSNDAGISILLGPVAAIDTVGGYTVYKCYVFLTSIGAVWALLATTRLLRGEEDTGRWQLTLAGGTRASRATLATLAALGGAVGIVFAGTTLITLLVGRNPDVGFGVRDTVVYGLSLAIAPAVFVGVGAVTSQLGRSRRLATGLGMAVFGVTFVLRMLADSGSSTKWLLWITPFGWIERMRPFADDDLRPFALAVVTVAVLVAVAALLAARRDVGEGVLASRDVAPLRPAGLGTPLGLVARLESPVLAAWCLGAAATAFSLGIIAKIAVSDVPESISDTLDKFGVRGTFLNQYLGVAFLFLATIVALLPASQIGSASQDETSGRLVHLLAQPTRRPRLLGGRLALAAVAIAAAGLLGGLAAWLGARSQGVDAGLSSMIGAGLNVVPTALVVLGIGAVVLAVAPRIAGTAMYVVVIWSLLVDLLASMVSSLEWLEKASLFNYMALAPAEDVSPTTVAATLALAAALCALATALFTRRDVQLG
jgi:ABC-2 type transport system permease protein